MNGNGNFWQYHRRSERIFCSIEAVWKTKVYSSIDIILDSSILVPTFVRKEFCYGQSPRDRRTMHKMYSEVVFLSVWMKFVDKESR